MKSKVVNNLFECEEKKYNNAKKHFTVDGHLLHSNDILLYAAKNYPDRIALIYKDIQISYVQLYWMADAYLKELLAHGVNKNDKVLICFENSPAFYVAYYATWQLGAIIIPVNTFLSAYELSHIIIDAKPKCIVTSDDRVELFKENGAQNIPVLTLQEIPEIPTVTPEITRKYSTKNFEDMVALLYTSGTTGLPKGVMLSSKNIITNMLQSFTRLTLDYRHRVFAVLPLFHVFAQNTCVWVSLCAGATIILVPKISRREILRNVKHKPTIFLGVPALYGLLCMLRTVNFSSVELFFSGGDALPDKIRTYFSLLYHRKICNGYGLTETSPVIAVDLDDYISPTGCLGVPVYGVDCSVRDKEGNELQKGKIGQLWVRGDNVMLGYYNAPEATKNVMKDGWFDTGDRVYINRYAKLVIAGREKDLIIHKGLNIYPQEIENVLLSHSLVIRVGVVGKIDQDGDEIPVAFVQVTSEKESIEKELITLCKQRLAQYKIPRQFFYQTDDLPLTATNKVDKKVLRKKINS